MVYLVKQPPADLTLRLPFGELYCTLVGIAFVLGNHPYASNARKNPTFGSVLTLQDAASPAISCNPASCRSFRSTPLQGRILCLPINLKETTIPAMTRNPPSPDGSTESFLEHLCPDTETGTHSQR